MKKKFSREDIMNFIDDQDLEPIAINDWRHGSIDTYVFVDQIDKDVHYYKIDVPVHFAEGWQLSDVNECERVVPVERTVTTVVTDWLPYKED